MKYEELKQKYPKFIYENYSYKISGNNLDIFFDFRIVPRQARDNPERSRRVEPGIFFKPKVIIENVKKPQLARMGNRVLNNLIFHIGLIEIPSYWKTTCSPEIEIRAGYLNKEQINWWRRLIINGMGQFFYENKIDWRSKSFLTIKSPLETRSSSVLDKKLKNRCLVPFAGGRDSIVTLESLKKSANWRKEISLFMVNPTERILKTAKVSGIKNKIIVRRIVDKKLLELNKKGYLNGHTPFTALLSFLSVLGAVLLDYKNIVFSNEKSANEGNLKYLGKTINHQWAKSSEFEKMFKNYCKKYLAKNLPAGRQGINYFSYLRKYGELEISKMFIKYPQYFSVFSSCNASMRIVGPPSLKLRRVKWCGNCPKCLFVYMTFYPFLEKKDLLKIFGRDIFNPSTSSGQEKLLAIMKALIGQGKPKPFECVGTKKEGRLALKLSLQKAKKSGKVPFLLTKIK